MKIETYIAGLLFEHDCVIVPGFGGFVSNYAPAVHDAGLHLFRPPHKRISFNKHLKNNDGLLANRISVCENKSFSEALHLLHSYRSEWVTLLNRGDKIVLENIGLLYQDTESNIQFEPDTTVNYLVDAFGMTPIQSLPVKREGLQNRIEKQFTDRKPLPQEKIVKNRGMKTSTVVTMLLVLFASSIVFLSIRTNLVRELNYSSLNLMNRNSKPGLNFNELVPVKTPAPTSKIHEAEKTQNPDKTRVVPKNEKPSQEARYHIIGGCFRVKENAFRYLRRMKDIQLDASIIGQNKDGLYMVSCGNFRSEQEAGLQLPKIRSVINGAWLLEKQ